MTVAEFLKAKFLGVSEPGPDDICMAFCRDCKRTDSAGNELTNDSVMGVLLEVGPYSVIKAIIDAKNEELKHNPEHKVVYEKIS